jgi:sigma-B regulation protein RsbU (phosphoserine phosphatase)
MSQSSVPPGSFLPISPGSDAATSVGMRYRDLTWQQRLEHVVATMREISTITDPQEMATTYGRRMRGTVTPGPTISISRRDLQSPQYRITRSSLWPVQPDPWRERDKLPLFDRGILGELLYADEPRIVTSFRADPSDPAFDYLKHARSLLAIPMFENGTAINMVIFTSNEDQPIEPERLPDLVLTSNLFGRGTKALVLSRELREAYETLDRELRTVQEIQLSLLPRETPDLQTMQLATHYQTSRRAGGDYYDFFDLGLGPTGRKRLGILVADVSGHGTPAAVLMAITHAVAHLTPGQPSPPDKVLEHLNDRLCSLYTRDGGNFVTAIYGIYDDETRTFTFSNAGHPDPIVRTFTNGASGELACIKHPDAGPPLGVVEGMQFGTHEVQLSPGEALVLYTDGIPEAFNNQGQMFGDARLCDTIERAGPTADDIAAAIVQAVGDFAGLAARSDDRTLVVGVICPCQKK